MMDPITITMAAALAVGSALSAIAGSYAVTNYRATTTERKVEQLSAELHDHKLESARKFVTDAMLVKVEERVVSAINRLADRLDQIIDRQGNRRDE